MGVITGKLIVIILVICGFYLLLAGQSLSEFSKAFHGSHLEEVALGFIGGLVTIFLLKRKPQRKVGK
ncbi:hypothetical protein L0657_02240 [Dyadobacter sp. CY345]|uniref:hypothetical protein n=1 Tax=Dyadobacter sp. CY345 TaxID=2909335 RepID=UPI001F332E4B|nr:hypothetical protein [Dyadobacter sp. CY345]MCF2442760.1 hypothetical protein [Dyadobacter sp. CY345]